MPRPKVPKPNTLAAAQDIIEHQHARIQRHPAARANRIIHLVLFLLGGLMLVAAGIGLHVGEGNTIVQVLVGILLVAPETIGVAGATEAAKSFASSMGSTLGKVAAGKIGKKG